MRVYNKYYETFIDANKRNFIKGKFLIYNIVYNFIFNFYNIIFYNII